MKAYKLRLELQNHLDLQDPPHGLILYGVTSAADWFNRLTEEDKTLLIDYLIRENFGAEKHKKRKHLELAMLAKLSGSKLFLPLINIVEGDSSEVKHGDH